MGKIWIKAPDSAGQCCSCQTKTSPCSTCSPICSYTGFNYHEIEKQGLSSSNSFSESNISEGVSIVGSMTINGTKATLSAQFTYPGFTTIFQSYQIRANQNISIANYGQSYSMYRKDIAANITPYEYGSNPQTITLNIERDVCPDFESRINALGANSNITGFPSIYTDKKAIYDWSIYVAYCDPVGGGGCFDRINQTGQNEISVPSSYAEVAAPSGAAHYEGSLYSYSNGTENCFGDFSSKFIGAKLNLRGLNTGVRYSVSPILYVRPIGGKQWYYAPFQSSLSFVSEKNSEVTPYIYPTYVTLSDNTGLNAILNNKSREYMFSGCRLFAE